MDSDALLATADACLLAPFDLESRKLDAVFGALATRRLDYADLFFQYTRSEGWSLEEGIVKTGSFSIEQGVGVRALAGEKTAFAYSDEISYDALHDAAKATRASPELKGPTIASTLSSSASLRRPTTACSGLPAVSKVMSLIFLPFTPPLALISSTAISTAIELVRDRLTNGPVFAAR